MLAIVTRWLQLFFRNATILDKMSILGQAPRQAVPSCKLCLIYTPNIASGDSLGGLRIVILDSNDLFQSLRIDQGFIGN